MNDVGNNWLNSGRYASIEGIDLLPRENQFLKGTPLVVARGQAEAFFLKDRNHREWILKKFLPGRSPDSQYIKAIQSLIPQEPGFESGYQRRILAKTSVSSSGYYSTDFSLWLENTILMPKIKGCDWAYLADKVREGDISLSTDQRLLLCRNLSEKVRLLESNCISHRDISSTNIFLDTTTWDVHLIDWDSLYHSRLSMPMNTTFGTNGYTAPFVKVNGAEDSGVTWRQSSDRFALAILNVEFLSIQRGSPFTGDGGMFDQDEIYNLRGQGISSIISGLQRSFPNAVYLLERALRAPSFDQCPTPDEWITFSGIGAGFKAPSLSDVYDPKRDFESFLQEIQKPRRPVPAAPSLDAVEKPDWSRPIPQAKPQAAHPAPSLDDVEDPLVVTAPQTTPSVTPTAPNLSDVEDPTGGINNMLGKRKP